MLTEEQIRDIRNAFDDAIAPWTCEWHFKEYGLKLDYDQVMGAIKVLDCILENPETILAEGVFMVRKEE